ncbi:MAG: hypothetical protein NT007_06665 [Candidatus Kapabacteria bacterium]|nr:hypothetical protein [Candidatus Kapabacteria bacterium]
MKRFFLQNVSYKLLSLFAIAFITVAFINSEAAINKPQTPLLCLTGASGNYNPDWYPDGRIWYPASIDANNLREFLMPVFIDNRWYTYAANSQFLKADPIKSFEFAIKYDGTAIKAIGIQATHPTADVNDKRYQDSKGNYYEPLAKNFNISTAVQLDTNDFRKYLTPSVVYSDRIKGMKLTINGSATTEPLPLCDTTSDSPDFKILFYVKFQILVTPMNIGANANTPIYIDPSDTIRYNNHVVTRDTLFVDQVKVGMNPDVLVQYRPQSVTYADGNPRKVTGVDGIANDTKMLFQTEPMLPGCIYLRISDVPPQFDFRLERGKGSAQQLNEIDDANNNHYWDVVDPITVDSAGQNPYYGKRTIQVINGATRTRLADVEIETDQPWLTFVRDQTKAGKQLIQDPNDLRRARINWIDAGILGDIVDPRENPTTIDPSVYLEIRCDQKKLAMSKTDEKCGVYTGFITFKSKVALDNPVRVRVTFILFRPPLEPYRGTGTLGGRKFGIDLTLKDSKSPTGEVCDIVFGTGYRATDSQDSLFGEYAYNMPPSGFTARFYPVKVDANPLLNQFGFGDWSPNDETPQTISRDIRSSFDTVNSIMYKVRFVTDDVSYYPVTVEWDVRDFPDGARLYLRDTTNGSSHFNINMRNATPIGPFKYSYAIQDPRWTSFLIEYTLPRVIHYVDGNGKPVIKNGWNLLAMPVLPVNNDYKTIYPNAMNTPIKYQQLYLPQNTLNAGVGYFIKYPQDVVDTTFTGAYIMKVDRTNSPERLYGSDNKYSGWNTVGGPSYPIGIDKLKLDAFNTQDPPDVKESFKRGVYAYITKQGYKEVLKIDPGIGYWLYCNKGAYLNLFDPNPVFVWWYGIGKKDLASGSLNPTKDFVFNTSTKVIIRDNSQNEGTLYLSNNNSLDLTNFELPPVPPLESFDARFTNNCSVNNSNNSVIKLQAVELPVSLTIENADANYTVLNPITSEVYGHVTKGNSSSIIAKSNMIQVLKSDVSGYLQARIDNASNIYLVNYSIPEEGNVTIKLYDILGNEVKTLLNSNRIAGSYSDLTINANELLSGTYIMKMACGSFTASQSVNITK